MEPTATPHFREICFIHWNFNGAYYAHSQSTAR